MHFHQFQQTLYAPVLAGNTELAETIHSLMKASESDPQEPGVERPADVDLQCCLDPHLYAGFTSGAPGFCPAQTLSDTLEERAVCPHGLATRARRRIPVTGRARPVIAKALRRSADLPHDEPGEVEVGIHMPHIERAWSLIQSTQPALFRLLEATLQQILLFRSTRLNSFASLSMHGLAGLNVDHGSSLTFFIDDLCHQGGHVIFNALTSNTACYLKVNADTPLAMLVNAPEDQRSVYSAFHGLYTYTCILGTLAELYSGTLLSPLDRNAALARIVFYLDKFGLDLALLSDPALFTADGHRLYEQLHKGQQLLSRQFDWAIGSIDLSDQPYVFSEQMLLWRNPQLISKRIEPPSSRLLRQGLQGVAGGRG